MTSRFEPSPDELSVPETDAKSDVYDTHYRLVVQNAPDYAIFTMDLEGIIRTWNPAAARIMGYTEPEIVGQSAALIFTPEDRAAGVPQREMVTTEIVPSAEALHGSGMVLVIEDEIAIRRVIKIGLEAYGYTVTLAENGKEGLEQLERRAGQVDLVVLDIAMPVMGGEEVMREIQRLYPGLPVVIMTGLGDMDAMNQLREHGISGFMEKPFTPEHLAREVKRVLAPGAHSLNRRAARSSSTKPSAI